MGKSKSFEAWEEIKSATVEEVAGNLRPDATLMIPPVLKALEVLCVPQRGIAKILKTKQPRISLFRQGKAKPSIAELERLCELAEAMIERAREDLDSLFDTEAGKAKLGIPIQNEGELEATREITMMNIELADVLVTIQEAMISKSKHSEVTG